MVHGTWDERTPGLHWYTQVIQDRLTPTSKSINTNQIVHNITSPFPTLPTTPCIFHRLAPCHIFMCFKTASRLKFLSLWPFHWSFTPPMLNDWVGRLSDQCTSIWWPHGKILDHHGMLCSGGTFVELITLKNATKNGSLGTGCLKFAEFWFVKFSNVLL